MISLRVKDFFNNVLFHYLPHVLISYYLEKNPAPSDVSSNGLFPEHGE